MSTWTSILTCAIDVAEALCARKIERADPARWLFSVALAVVLATLGAGFLAAGIFMALAAVMNPALAAVVSGAICTVGALSAYRGRRRH